MDNEPNLSGVVATTIKHVKSDTTTTIHYPATPKAESAPPAPPSKGERNARRIGK